jgi:hypothetical protein
MCEGGAGGSGGGATATATIPAPVDRLFAAIAVDRRQSFRRDIEGVEVLSDTRWRERANDSPPVEYEQVRRVPNSLFEAHFRGRGCCGRRLVRFARTGDDATTIDIQVEVMVKHFLLRPIGRASYPLQAAVDRFVADLRDAADDFAGEVP